MNSCEKIKILPFDKRYKDQIISLIVWIQQKEFDLPITAEDQPDLHDIKGFYQARKGNFWIALEKDNVVGTISILDIGNRQVALRKMFVKQEYRGAQLSIAQKLLETLLSWSKFKEIKEIFLGTTPKFLAAHRFYEKMGFTEIKTDLLPKSFPIMKVDTKFYKYVV